MKFNVDTPLQPSGPGAGSSVRYDMDPAGIHATLVDVAADGESLLQAAKDTRSSGDRVADKFGSAEVAATGFSSFWGDRDDVGERVASLLFRKADAVSTAAHAFTEADGEMTTAASAALSRLPATSPLPHSGGLRPEE